MNDSWTDAERLAAEVLASGSDDALRQLLVELDRGLPTPSRPTPSSPPVRPPGRSKKRRRGPSPAGPRRDLYVPGPAVDSLMILLAMMCIAVGARPLLPPVADARPVVVEAIDRVAAPVRSRDAGAVRPLSTASPVERPASENEPISLQARDLEATVGRYGTVAGMYAGRKLTCSQLRQSYSEVERAWIRYSVARGKTYGDRLPDRLVRWDEALYQAVGEVDRQFTASGCRRP